MSGLLARLDAYGTDDPGFNEGQPEDRCPVCERAVDDHPGFERWCYNQDGTVRWVEHSAKWPHRRAALRDIVLGWLTR